MAETTELRYFVKKDSGSRYAFVMDRETGISLARFDVLRGGGWEKADLFRDRLNAQALKAEGE